jgi:LPS export ABC transporter protein LptC
MDARNLLSLSGVLLVLGAAGYYWGMGNPPPVDTSPATERRPDYVVQGIGSVETDDQGRLLRRLSAKELRHYDGNPDMAELDSPVLTFYDKGQEAWRVVAARGESHAQSTEVRLVGGVVAERRNADIPVTVTAPSLTVFPREERLVARQGVTISSPRGQIASGALEGSMKRSELLLSRQVTGSYAPAPR